MFILFWIALWGGLETEEVHSCIRNYTKNGVYQKGLHKMHTSPKQAFSPNPYPKS